jgi:flagellar basal-body rod protein FlgB
MNDIRSETAWLGTLLSSSTLRHRAVSLNLANAETPGYRPVHVRFEETLREMLRRSGRIDTDQIAGIRPEIVTDPGRQQVAVEQEIMDLIQNQLAYDTYAQVLSMRVGLLRSAIESGKG